MTDDLPSEDLEFEANLARQQKRKRIIGVSIGAAVVVAGVLVYLFWPKAPEPKCTEKDVRAFLHNKEIPSAALGSVCSFPSPLSGALRESAGAPPRYRHLILFKAVAENPSLVTSICPKALRAIANAGREVPAKHAGIYLASCDLAQMGIAPRSTLEGATLGKLVLATAVYAALKDSDPKWAKMLAREVCCSGRP